LLTEGGSHERIPPSVHVLDRIYHSGGSDSKADNQSAGVMSIVEVGAAIGVHIAGGMGVEASGRPKPPISGR